MTSRIIAVAMLAAISMSLPLDLTIPNAVIRGLLWLTFVFVAVGRDWMWRLGPSQWFVATQFLAYGTWSMFYIVGYYFFRYTVYYGSVVLRDAEFNAFQVDTGTFLFTAIAWTVAQLFGPKIPAFELDDKATTGTGSRPRALGIDSQVVLLMMGAFGAVALLFYQHFPAVLNQPVRLFGGFFFVSMALMCIHSNPNDPVLLRFRWPIVLTMIFGVFAFAGSGLKQMIFVTSLHLIWYIASVFPQYRKRAVVISACIAATFVALLPVFQYAKRAFLDSGSANETFSALMTGLQKYSQNDRLDDQELGNPAAVWRYLGNRVCLAVIPQIYLRNYRERPQGYETFRVSLSSLVPRVLDPDKQSIDEYFNDLARESGVGNKADRKTSRKPSFVEECIVVWGSSGFYLGGLVFGLYLVLLERGLALLARTPTELSIIRFAGLYLGQTPYSAVLIVALVYNLPFFGLILLPTIRWLLREQSSVRRTKPSMVSKGRLQGSRPLIP